MGNNMAYQAVFKRYEMKYMMTRKQHKAVLEAMLAYMRLDKFGHTQVRNVYFDTENYRLVRRSIEKPSYKEKLRIRSYEKVRAQDKIFVELKKKYDDVVYKRRESLPYIDLSAWLENEGSVPFPVDTQIGREIAYFFTYYQTIEAKVFLSYEREAFYALDGSDFRVTFYRINHSSDVYIQKRIFKELYCNTGYDSRNCMRGHYDGKRQCGCGGCDGGRVWPCAVPVIAGDGERNRHSLSCDGSGADYRDGIYCIWIPICGCAQCSLYALFSDWIWHEKADGKAICSKKDNAHHNSGGFGLYGDF